MRMHFSSILIVVALLSGHSAQSFAQSAKDKSDVPNARQPEMGNVPFDAEKAKRLQEEWAGHLSADKSVRNSIEMELILIPPGKFQSWEKVDVAVAEPFYLGQTEVTQAQW